MAGLDTGSRKAITKVLQEWREAYDEYAECQRLMTGLSLQMDDLTAKAVDAGNREEEAAAKLNEMADAHADDPDAMREINAIVQANTQGIMGVQVVSGGRMPEEEL